jgi:hypothetical protein
VLPCIAALLLGAVVPAASGGGSGAAAPAPRSLRPMTYNLN